jgi:choline kinase
MSKIDKAVILAAGLGNRISKAALGTPKPLLPIDGGTTTFLDFHLRALAKAGVREVYIVGNEKTHGTKLKAIDEVASTTRVQWILNPTKDLSTSGSGHSAQFAFASEHRILDGESRVVLMDADIAYEPRLFELLAQAPGARSKTLVCSDYRHTQEEVMVFVDAEGLPRVHGKGLFQSPLVAHLSVLGEATGILLFEPQDHALLRTATDWVIGYSTAKARSEHEDIVQRLMLAGRMQSVTFGKEVLFMECDTPEEYEILTKEMYPLLRARLER